MDKLTLGPNLQDLQHRRQTILVGLRTWVILTLAPVTTLENLPHRHQTVVEDLRILISAQVLSSLPSISSTKSFPIVTRRKSAQISTPWKGFIVIRTSVLEIHKKVKDVVTQSVPNIRKRSRGFLRDSRRRILKTTHKVASLSSSS